MLGVGMNFALALPGKPDAVIPVEDETGIFNANELIAIGKAADVNNSDVKIYTYIVPAVPNNYTSADEAAADVLNNWELSHNGILIYIATTDGQIVVQVGEKWQEALSNDMDRILSKTIVPSLKNDDYTGALISGINDIKSAVKENGTEVAPTGSTDAEERLELVLKTLLSTLIAVIGAVFLIGFIRKMLKVDPGERPEGSQVPSVEKPLANSSNSTSSTVFSEKQAKYKKDKMRRDIEQIQLSNPALFYTVLSEIEESNKDTIREDAHSSTIDNTSSYSANDSGYSTSYGVGSELFNTSSSFYESPTYNSLSSSYGSDFGSSYSNSYSADFGNNDSSSFSE